jgi:flagellar biogenesis protein FliO
MRYIKIGYFTIILCLLWSYTYALPEGIGDFDIEKVRKAALGVDSVQQQTNENSTQRTDISKVIVRITVYLGIIITLILFIAWLLRQNALKTVVRGGGGAMDVIETLPIGQNRMIFMVRVMDEIYLLSQTTVNIAVIEKISGQKALDIIASSKGGGAIIHFKDALNNFMGKIKKS